MVRCDAFLKRVTHSRPFSRYFSLYLSCGKNMENAVTPVTSVTRTTLTIGCRKGQDGPDRQGLPASGASDPAGCCPTAAGEKRQ